MQNNIDRDEDGVGGDNDDDNTSDSRNDMVPDRTKLTM